MKNTPRRNVSYVSAVKTDHDRFRTKIGYFWDVQNCRSPPDKSPVEAVRVLRAQYAHYTSEVRFDVVCDVTKVSDRVTELINLLKWGNIKMVDFET